MIPKEIFHYTKKDIALEKILYDKKIKIREFASTNDPRESKEWALRSLTKEQSKRYDDIYLDMVNETNKIISSEWKVFCASQHHPEYTTSGSFGMSIAIVE